MEPIKNFNLKEGKWLHYHTMVIQFLGHPSKSEVSHIYIKKFWVCFFTYSWPLQSFTWPYMSFYNASVLQRQTVSIHNCLFSTILHFKLAMSYWCLHNMVDKSSNWHCSLSTLSNPSTSHPNESVVCPPHQCCLLKVK